MDFKNASELLALCTQQRPHLRGPCAAAVPLSETA